MWKKDDVSDKLLQPAKLRTRLRFNDFTVEVGVPIWTKNGTRIIAVNNLSWRLHQLHRISGAARLRG